VNYPPPYGGIPQPTPPVPPPAPHPRRRRKAVPWILVGAFGFVLAIICTVIVLPIVGGVGWYLLEPGHDYTITYEVTGTAAQAEINYALSDDEHSDYVTVDLPWRQEVTLRGVKGPALASITAARGSADYAGLVGCRVIYQGRTIAAEPATSAYASCAGNAAA
jgi:hypothetical protein